MNAADFLSNIIDPACAALTGIVGQEMGDDRARVLLLAIALQETALKSRKQHRGPARGWFQFEERGGTAGVLNHAASGEAAKAVCAALVVPDDVATVYEALAWHDHLAAAFARLLLFTDVKPLPAVADANGGWEMYLHNWRPGKPHPQTWAGFHRTAVNTVTGVVTAPEPAALPPAITAAPGAISTVFKSGWKSSETWIAIASVAVPILLQLLDTAAANSSVVSASPYVGMAIYVARQVFKGMAALPVSPEQIPGTGK